MKNEQGGSIVKETVEVTDVHSNLNQEIIKITTDRLKLILKDYLTQLEKKREWIAPLGIFITLVVVLTTASFQKVLFSAETWKAVFVISAILSAAWLVKSVGVALRSPSIDDLVEKIKSGG